MDTSKQHGSSAATDVSAEGASNHTRSASKSAKKGESLASAEARALALAIAGVGLDKKATAVEILDVAGKVDYTEFLVLMTGRSDRHVHAISKGLQADLKEKHGAVPLSVEGMTVANWVLLDFNDVVVHVFQEDSRFFYDLEGLWIDARRLGVPSPPDRK